MRRVQAAYIYEAAGSFYVRYWDTGILTDDNTRCVPRSEVLRAKHDGETFLSTFTNLRTWCRVTPKAVSFLFAVDRIAGKSMERALGYRCLYRCTDARGRLVEWFGRKGHRS